MLNHKIDELIEDGKKSSENAEIVEIEGEVELSKEGDYLLIETKRDLFN